MKYLVMVADGMSDYPLEELSGRTPIESSKIPNINFIAAHLGGNASDLVCEAIKLLEKETIDNIYLDTSAIKLPWLIETAIEKLGHDKIIFGSDEPYADLRVCKYCIDIAEVNRKGLILAKNILTLINRE